MTFRGNSRFFLLITVDPWLWCLVKEMEAVSDIYRKPEYSFVEEMFLLRLTWVMLELIDSQLNETVYTLRINEDIKRRKCKKDENMERRKETIWRSAQR